MLTSTLYVDFGDLFPAGGLTGTVATLKTATSPGNPAVNGPNMDGASNGDFDVGNDGSTANDPLNADTFNLVSFVNRYTADGGSYTGGLAQLRTDIMSFVRRFYDPFDIDVIELTSAAINVGGNLVQAASSLADISTTLGANEAAAKNNDAYVMLGQMIVHRPPAAGGDLDISSLWGGYASTIDMPNSNGNDNSAVGFLGPGSLTNPNVGFWGNLIAHEAGHLFGLQHSLTQAPAGAVSPLIPTSEIMSYLGNNGFNFFSRYPMVRGNNNTMNNEDLMAVAPPAPAANRTPYDQWTNTASIGQNNDYHYITGTGAHDIITVTETGGNATVAVQAFSDATYSTALNVPGSGGASTTYSYTLSLDRPFVIDGGDRNDRIVLDGDLGNTITVRGMNGTDELIVMGKNAASGTYTPGTNSATGMDGNSDLRGAIIIGATTINFQEFEAASKVTVQDVTTFTMRTPLGSDSLIVSSPMAGKNRVFGLSGGVSIVPLDFSNIGGFVLDTGTNDGASGNDTINMNAALVAASLQNFTINTGDGNDVDFLNINVNNIGLPVGGGAFAFHGGAGGVDTIAFTTATPTAVTYTPDGFNDPARGTLTFGGNTVTFTGLEFAEPVTPEVGGIAISSPNISEGDAITLTGDFIDPGSLSSHILSVNWGDGNVTNMPLAVGDRSFSINYTYLDDNPTGTPFDVNNIQVTLTDNDTLSDLANAVITVDNLDPVIVDFASDATFGNKAVAGQPVNILANFTDVGILDTHVAVVDWGDGTVEMVTVNQGAGVGTVTGSHPYATGGIFDVTLTLTDDDTGSTVAMTTAVVSGVGLTAGGELQIIGTDTNDRATITQSWGQLRVFADFILGAAFKSFDPDDVQKIVAYFCDGNDYFVISSNIDIPAIAHGGAGNDLLKAGRGPTVLLGDDGNDRLMGGNGRDILIGGLGVDLLMGGLGDDLLIGGTTLHDHDDLALMDLITEWNENVTYNVRLGRLRDGTGATGVQLALGLTVFDDLEDDRLVGSSGRDWFFNPLEDSTPDRQNNEGAN